MANNLDSLIAAASCSRSWMFDAALPFWFNNGIDWADGGFFDLLAMDGSPVDAPKRTFVQARQICVFVDAGRLGWPGPWREAVGIGLETIEQRCIHPEDGVIHSFTKTGEPFELRRDLYDQAFVALAYAKAASGLVRPDYADRSRQILAMLDEKWSRQPGGYFEGELRDGLIRRQNPHMHLFEAAIELAGTSYAVTADTTTARALAGLLQNFFYQRESDALCEYYDLQLRPHGGELGFVAEPGHHYEWVWLLNRFEQICKDSLDAELVGLWTFAEKHGIDAERNVAVDEIFLDGRTRNARARLWPQTERLKATIAMFERTNSSATDVVRAFEGLQRYLSAPTPGLFYDKQRTDGSFIDEPARASSLYHIVTAYAELDRVVRNQN